jgi:hypothetical protein
MMATTPRDFRFGLRNFSGRWVFVRLSVHDDLCSNAFIFWFQYLYVWFCVMEGCSSKPYFLLLIAVCDLLSDHLHYNAI